MNISFVQSDLVWEGVAANLSKFSSMIESISKPTDIIILPEMFSTGFTMNPKFVAEEMNGNTVSWMIKTAAAVKSAICGSVVISENGNYYNRLLFVEPSGKVHHYDKRHLFSLAGEEKVYAPGRQKLIVEYKGWKICPLICYDLRFPVFSRNAEDYDLLIYVANWPEPRIQAWDALLKARAIENMAYVVGVNRVGIDGNDNKYVGHSQILDCLGKQLIAPSENIGVFTGQLDKKELERTREKFGFLNDRDSFTVN